MNRLSDFAPAILATGTALPEFEYDQSTLIKALGVEGKNRRFFEHPHIEKRHLILPEQAQHGIAIEPESYGALIEKYLDAAPDLSIRAMEQALSRLDLKLDDIDFLCCVTSTAFLLPGLSKILLRRLNRFDCQHADIVGMGCSAGVNGLSSVANWCSMNPGKNAVLLCCEIASALYDHDDAPETAIVNSLFGDGVAAAVVSSGGQRTRPPMKVLVRDFQSQLLDANPDWFRYRWIEERSRYSFYLNKKIPKAIAAEIDKPVDAILNRNNLRREDIRHWLFHTGGEAILSGIQAKLSLDDADLEHSRTVLKNHGNLSSASILFTLESALHERSVDDSAPGLIVAMGPGPGVEACLVEVSSG